MFATALALIAQEFEGRERAQAVGIWGATVGGAVAIGPLVGGVITEGLGWEWIFFVNVPIGLAAIVITETKLVNIKATDPQPIDWAGLVTFSAALFLLIFGLIRGNSEGWGSGVIVACLAAAVALLVAFAVHRDPPRERDAGHDPVPQARRSRACRSSRSASRRGCSRCSCT